jgi:hypothetical protein
MIKNPNAFRIATVLIGLALGWFALATILGEKLTPKMPQFPQDLALSDSPSSLAEWAAAAAPLRGDLLTDVAMARAMPALGARKAPPSSEITATRERALALAKQSLALAPHSSRTWLLAAKLQNQAPQPQAEALKMSYLTAPADANLIPARLTLMATAAGMANEDLKSLARSDIRLILSRRPDLKPAITSAYQSGPPEAKAYIRETARSLDAGFGTSLQ